MKIVKQCSVRGKMFFPGEEIADELVTDYMRENGYVGNVDVVDDNDSHNDGYTVVETLQLEDTNENKEELLLDSSSDVSVVKESSKDVKDAKEAADLKINVTKTKVEPKRRGLKNKSKTNSDSDQPS